MPAPALRMEPAPTPDPVAALITRGAHRDALAACARTHGAVMGRVCMALLGSQADADEAVQETLLAAHGAMPSYRGDGTVKAWLCGIARHMCARKLEGRRRDQRLLEAVPTQDHGHDALATRQRARALRAALDQLKPSEREALLLRYVADLSHRELAAACHIDEAAARKRVSRALATLRTVISTDEITKEIR